MSNSKQISTSTITNTTGSSLRIFTFYDKIKYNCYGCIDGYGPELTNDPTFTTDGIWYEAGHNPISRSGGSLIISELLGANISTDFILQIGKTYLVEIVLDSIGFGSIQLFSGEPVGSLLTITTPGTYSVVVTKTTSFNFFVLAATLFNGATISKFSVMEVTGSDCNNIVSGLPNILKSFISEISNATQDNVPYKEGELIIAVKNFPNDISFYINTDGEFILTSDDCDQYYIDDNGDLIYDPCL